VPGARERSIVNKTGNSATQATPSVPVGHTLTPQLHVQLMKDSSWSYMLDVCNFAFHLHLPPCCLWLLLANFQLPMPAAVYGPFAIIYHAHMHVHAPARPWACVLCVVVVGSLCSYLELVRPAHQRTIPPYRRVISIRGSLLSFCLCFLAGVSIPAFVAA
jgi:hypothetical protein